MPEPYIINGIITPADGAERAGIRVQAFDRDLPSRERLAGSGPQMLGEATTDAEGRFQITYTLEQFQSGDAISQFRRVQEKNADLSFRVFARTKQELIIKGIEALDHEYGPKQIIFNAPTPINVSIFIEAPQAAGTSEYEQLIALIAPVVEDLPLIELSDEDIFFLTNELGIEQQREVQQHIEWLRRCALLAEETNLPIEAFYGWGRKNVPAAFAELAAVPLKDLPKVSEKLTSFSEEELRSALLAAIEENIIPATFRSRLDNIVRQIKRRNQVLQTVVAQLLDTHTNTALVAYTVTTYDQDDANENLGLDITDNEGKFSFNIYRFRDLAPDVPSRNFSFEIVTPGGKIILEKAHAALDLHRPEDEVVLVKFELPALQAQPFEEQLLAAQLQAPPELLKWLKTEEINTFADIRRKGGLRQLADLPQVAPTIVHQIEALADLDRVSSTVQVNKALMDKGYDSVLAIAGAPYSEFISHASDANSTLTPLEAAQLHVIATIQTNLLNTILAGMAADSANGFNLSEPKE